MTSPLLALRGAILAQAKADAALATLMGGTVRFYDEPPRAAEPVYAVFGDVTAEDWSTDLDRGHEHSLSLAIWAKPGSGRTALLAAERIAILLDEADLVLDGQRLIALRVAAVETGCDTDTQLALVTLRLRAVKEALS